MEDKFKDKIVNGLKNSYKITKDSLKSLYNKSLANIAYISESSLFYVVKLDNQKEVNQLFHGIFDEKELIIYIKVSKNKDYKEYLKKNCHIKIEGNDTKYYIEKIDLKESFDYLIKFNDKYQSVSCYKIFLKEL